MLMLTDFPFKFMKNVCPIISYIFILARICKFQKNYAFILFPFLCKVTIFQKVSFCLSCDSSVIFLGYFFFSNLLV